MKYLCLVYCDEKKMQQLSQDEWDALNRECIACVAGLQASGHCLEGAPLLSTETATTVRVRDGGPLITDGPFADPNHPAKPGRGGKQPGSGCFVARLI